MCAGCPHRGLFYAFVRNKVTVLGDITAALGAAPSARWTTICMGASISGLHGFNVAARKGKSAPSPSSAIPRSCTRASRA